MTDKCQKAKDPQMCYRCISLCRQLLQVDIITPEDQEKVKQIMQKIEQGCEISSVEVTSLQELKHYYF